MRIREGCILTATNSSDERVKSLIGCFDKTALCYDIGSVHSLASAIMRICATYENLTNFRKVFVERLVISKERMNEIKQYTDGGKKQDEIEF